MIRLIVFVMKQLVALLTASSFSFWFSINMIRPIFPLFLSDLGASSAEIGFIVAIPFLVAIFIRIPLASKASKVGKLWFLGIALLANSISLALYGLFNTLPPIYLIRFIHSISMAAFGPVAIAAVSILTPIKERGSVMGSYMTITALAMFLGPGVTSLLSIYVNTSFIFILSSIPTFIFSFLILYMARKEVHGLEVGEKSLTRGFSKLINNKVFMLISISTITYSLSLGFFRSFFPIYMGNIYLLSISFISALYMVRGVFNVISRPISGFLEDRIGVRNMIIYGLSFVLLSFILIFLQLPLSFIIIAMILNGIGWGLRAVSTVNFISFVLDEKLQDIGMAFFYNMFDIGLFVGSITGGVLSLYTSLNLLFGVYSIVVFIGIIVLLPIKEITYSK